MNLEYLLVGIARDQEEDYRSLYEATRCAVFGLSLSIVKDRQLAREIMVETYRRVHTFAYTFDTDWNGEYWILDIVQNLSVNALRDPELQEIAAEKRLDNVSHLLRQTILDTKNDRGSMILLHALTELRNNDIARLLWYHQASARQEFRRGRKQLLSWDKEREESTLLKTLRQDVEACTPDVWDRLSAKEPTKVSQVSHELQKAEEEIPSEENQDCDTKSSRSRKLRTLMICIVGVLVLSLLIGILYLILGQESGTLSGGANVQYQTKLAMVEVDNVLYFQNPADGDKLYAAELSGDTKDLRKLCDDAIKELLSDGVSLYYRNNTDGKIYRIAFDGSQRTKLADHSGAALALYEDWLYYSGSNGINRMHKDGTNVEEVLNTEDDATLFRYQIAVADGVVYFSSGVGKGIHYVKEYEGTPLAYNVSKGFYDEVYAFQMEGGYLYFDFLLGDQITLQRVELSSGERKMLPTLPLVSGANYTVGNQSYYYGCEENAEGKGSLYGIYVYDAQTNTNTLFCAAGNANFAGTELLIGSKYLYCYFSDGKEDGKRQLIAYDREDPSKKIVIQS